jgi:hypothetical protein
MKRQLRELNRKQDDQLVKLTSLETSVGDVHKTLSTISVTLGKQEENLKEHMRRTELLEKGMEKVHSHVTVVQGIGSILKWIAVVAPVIGAVTKLMKFW